MSSILNKIFLNLFLILSIYKSIQINANCIWYGECGPTGQNDGRYNCKYTGEAILQTNETFLKLYKDVCPHLYVDENNTRTCCDYAQLYRFSQDLSVPRQLLSRCPACFLNFKAYLCDFTCHPNQSEFHLVTQEQEYIPPSTTTNLAQYDQEEDEENENEDEEKNEHKRKKRSSENDTPPQMEIVRLTYHLTNYFANNLYNSCKDVQYASSNQKAMDLLCGTSVDKCSPKVFLDYMGNNPQSPFAFDMNITDSEYDVNSTLHIKPANTTMHLCSKPVVSHYFNGSACGCSDCDDSCPVPIPPPTVKPCKILTLDCVDLASIVLFLIFTASFLLTLVISKYTSKRRNTTTIKQISEDRLIDDDEDEKEISQKMLNLVTENSNNSNNFILNKNGKGYSDTENDLSSSNGIDIENGKAKFSSEESEYLRGSFFQRFGYLTDNFLNSAFTKLGFLCASYPITVLLIGIVFCLGLAGGFYFFSVITDPVELWSPEDSQTRINKNYYDSHFRPFYRTTQLIIRPKNQSLWIHSIFDDSGAVAYNNAFQLDFLLQVLQLQNEVSDLKGVLVDDNGQPMNKTVGLKDICFAPLLPDNDNCTIQSVLNYWQNDENNLRKTNTDFFGQATADYITHFETCSKSPTSVNDSLGLSCLGTYGGPVMPFVALGGYPNVRYHEQYGNATALIITYIINNHKDPNLNLPAMAWEKAVIEYLKNYTNENMTISFSTERSIQDELDRESKSDISTIFISYMAMFLYITLTLGKYRVCSNNKSTSENKNIFYRIFNIFERLLVDMKFSLGIAGVIIVMLSVASSIGLFSYFHVKATLIIFEVIPFLVLAVGVDNIFILVQNYQRDRRRKNETLEEQIARIVGKVGPSMLLTSSAESLAFLLGALTPMPAVKIFSLYASLAVFIDFILQITLFVSLMTLDCKRELSKRYNLLCCIKSFTLNESKNNVNNELEQSISTNGDLDKKLEEENSGLLFRLFKNYYAPFIVNKKVRPVVIVLFLALFFTSVSFVPKVDVGLDQKLSMPKDSYVLDYFLALENYLSVGVPVYFVLKNVDDYSKIENQNLICSTSGCNIDSMLNQINQASLQTNYTYIAIAANSWLDDYFDWLSSGDCCRLYSNDTTKFCPSTSNDTNCIQCPVTFQVGTNRPIRDDFYKYFMFYLKDNPGLKCAKGGHAAYGESIEIIKSKNDTSYQIGSTFFMAYHSVGVTSKDFIGSLRHANDISANITKMLKDNLRSTRPNDTDLIEKIEVIPYSVSYVYYEQYLTIWKDGSINLSVSLTSIFIVCGLLLGLDFYTSFLVCLTIVMIIVNMFGAMFLLDIEFNAVSLVNLVMTVGISVEFCAHTARDFALSTRSSRINRAKYSIAHMGSSVFSGITLTKILGIVILAFSHSQLFQVFYFRMYFSVVVLGASHGLVFLPVLLSYIGPSVNKLRIHRK